MAGSLDANVLLRLLLKDVPAHHNAARRLLARGRFTISEVALVETSFVLSRHYGMTRHVIAASLLAFVRAGDFDVDQELLTEALTLFDAHPKLSVEDCFLVARAGRDAAPLWTFDKKLANQTSARLVPVAEPVT